MHWSRLSVLLIALMLLGGCLGDGDKEWRITFNGNEMTSQPAPDFTLTNQNGDNVSLSDFEGKVVVIAFTYTSCPDVCPVIESNLNIVKSNLGDVYGEEVVFISISIDPGRDTPEKLKSHWIDGLGYEWDHLTHSDLSTISQVWSDYNLVVDEEMIELHLGLNQEVSADWIEGFNNSYPHWEAGHISNTSMIDKILESFNVNEGNDTDENCERFNNTNNTQIGDLAHAWCVDDLDDSQFIIAVHNITAPVAEEEHQTTEEETSNDTVDYNENEAYIVGHSSLTLILDADHKKRVAWPGFAWDTDEFTDDVQALLGG